MIKDVLVSLAGHGPQDFVTNYAVSLGASFGAHLVGIRIRL